MLTGHAYHHADRSCIAVRAGELSDKYPDYKLIMHTNKKYKIAINEVIAIDGAIWGVGYATSNSTI